MQKCAKHQNRDRKICQSAYPSACTLSLIHSQPFTDPRAVSSTGQTNVPSVQPPRVTVPGRVVSCRVVSCRVVSCDERHTTQQDSGVASHLKSLRHLQMAPTAVEPAYTGEGPRCTPYLWLLTYRTAAADGHERARVCVCVCTHAQKIAECKIQVSCCLATDRRVFRELKLDWSRMCE
jgi:hypothetical protein